MHTCLPKLPPLFRRIRKAVRALSTRLSSDRIPSDSEANDKANGVMGNGMADLHDPSGHLHTENNDDDRETKAGQEDIMV